MSSELSLSDVFLANLYCKMCDLFFCFLLFLRLSARNSEIKNKISDDVHQNVWTNTKTLYIRNTIFKKRIPNIRFLIIYVFVQISCLWDCSRAFQPVLLFNSSLSTNHGAMVADIFTQPLPPPPPTIKKLPTALPEYIFRIS